MVSRVRRRPIRRQLRPFLLTEAEIRKKVDILIRAIEVVSNQYLMERRDEIRAVYQKRSWEKFEAVKAPLENKIGLSLDQALHLRIFGVCREFVNPR